jgi:tungstate transport system substrate-binding protein
MRLNLSFTHVARLAALPLLGALVPLRAVAAPAIVLASTTSVQDSGLLDCILPAFMQATGIEVRVMAQGTGQALETARRGDVDVVLVHDPEAEEKFIGEGFGIDRRQIAWNDFVIVGPKDDPARINHGHDAIAAFKAIAAAKAPFISRGDKSGTNALELRLWKAAGIDPAKRGAGTWYRDIGSGMGAALKCRLCHGGLHALRPRNLVEF